MRLGITYFDFRTIRDELAMHELSILAMLGRHADILDGLKKAGATRSYNNPTGDYAEYLFSKAFGWDLETNSKAGYDAIDDQKHRYQIKSRRMVTGKASERRLGTMRDTNTMNFDSLAAVLFKRDFTVDSAIIIPYDITMRLKSEQSHVNGSFVILRGSAWLEQGVRDVTAELREAENQFK